MIDLRKHPHPRRLDRSQQPLDGWLKGKRADMFGLQQQPGSGHAPKLSVIPTM
jgi:hypothetical protein